MREEMQRTVKQLFCVTALAACALAQTPSPQPRTASTKPATKAGAKPAPRSAAKHAKPRAAVKKNVTGEVAKKVADKQAEAAPAKWGEAEAPKSPSRRDPFVNPLKLRQSQAQGLACGSGVRCLVIEQITLKGVIKTQQGMIAMIENDAKRSYNLHDNDVLFNGSVVKITEDSVIFREQVVDTMGRTSTKEVVKRVTAPAV